MNDFFRFWFSGVNEFLKSDKTGHDEAVRFLEPCARKCSDSYPLAIYQKAFADGASLESALGSVKASFGDSFDYEIQQDLIFLSYSRCGCELVSEKLVDAPRLCSCSQLSLQYIWENLFGKGNVRVTLRESILNGNSRCLFQIKVRQLGHF